MLILTLSSVSSAYGQTSLEILGVSVPAQSTPYDTPVVVSVTVKHSADVTPTVTVYYACFLNQTVLLPGWRIAVAQQSFKGPGLSIFIASIPNNIYGPLPYNTKIVFYAEATDGSTVALSCNANDRWDPNTQSDKQSIVLTDPYPPFIQEVRLAEGTATFDSNTTVLARVTEPSMGSGVRSVTLFYSVNRATWISVVMNNQGYYYVAVIPKQNYGTIVYFYVSAIDKSGNLSTLPSVGFQSYMVADRILPSITGIQQDPKAPSSADSVTIAASVTDRGSGVDSSTIRYSTDGGKTSAVIPMVQYQDGYRGTIPAQSRGTAVTYQIEAKDAAGNTVVSSIFSYEVSSSLTDILAYWAQIFVDVAIALIVFLPILRYRKKLKAIIGKLRAIKGFVTIKEALKCKYPKAMAILTVIVLTGLVWLYTMLASTGSSMLASLLIIWMLIFWCLIDPRIGGPSFMKEQCNENPTLTLILSSLALMVAGGVLVAGGFLLGFYTGFVALDSAVKTSKLAIYFLGAGIVLQIFWPYLRVTEIKVETITREGT